MKKLLLNLTFLLCAFAAMADSTATLNGIRYYLNDEKHVAVVLDTREDYGPSQYKGAITIPSSVTNNGEKYTVIGIGNYAFYQCKLSSLKLPETLTFIGNEAFAYCTGPEYLIIPDNVVSIGNNTFNYFATKAIRMPNSLERIKDDEGNVFASVRGLELIEFPSEKPIKALGDNYKHLMGSKIDLVKINAQSVAKKFDTSSLGEPANTPSAVKGKFYWKKNTAGKRYLVNEAGKTILPASAWDSVWFEGNAIVIKKNGKFGVYSYSGKKIVAPLYNKYEGCGAEGRLLFSNNLANGAKLFVYSKNGALLASRAFSNNTPYLVASWMKQWIPMFISF